MEKDKWSGPHPQRFKTYRWEDMVAGEVSKSVGNADGLLKTVQDNTGWLHLVQHRVSWRQFAKFEKSTVGALPNASGTQVRPALRGLMLMGAGGVEWPRLAPKAVMASKMDG